MHVNHLFSTFATVEPRLTGFLVHIELIVH